MSVYRSADDAVVRLGALVRRRADLAQRLEALASTRRRLAASVRSLETRYASEQRDVERLEQGGLGRLVGVALGRGELHAERAEALQAAFALHAKRVEFESVVGELSAAQNEYQGLRGVDADYRRAFELKIAHILQTSSPDAAAVRARIEEVTSAAHQLRQLDEALFAGRELRDNLHRLRKAVVRFQNNRSLGHVRLWHAVRNRSLGLKLRWTQDRAHHYLRALQQLPWGGAPRWPTDLLTAFSRLARRGGVTGRPMTVVVGGVQRQLHGTQSELHRWRAGVRDAHNDALRRYTEAVERA